MSGTKNPLFKHRATANQKKQQQCIVSTSTHTHVCTQQSQFHINTAMCSLVSNYPDNWGFRQHKDWLTSSMATLLAALSLSNSTKTPHPNQFLSHTHAAHTHTVTLNEMMLYLIWRVFDRHHFNDPGPWWGLKLTETSIGTSITSGRNDFEQPNKHLHRMGWEMLLLSLQQSQKLWMNS